MIIQSTAQQGSQRRIGGIAFVVGFHIVAAYALLNGLGAQMIKLFPKALETKVIHEVKVAQAPQIQPDLVAPPPPGGLNMPEYQINRSASANAIAAPKKEIVPVKPISLTMKSAIEVPPVVDPEKACSKPEYPGISRRLGESGTVALMMLIDTTGKVVDSKLEKSSGYSRLDQAARDALALCKFKPGTSDGQPALAWAPMNYKFQLN